MTLPNIITKESVTIKVILETSVAEKLSEKTLDVNLSIGIWQTSTLSSSFPESRLPKARLVSHYV